MFRRCSSSSEEIICVVISVSAAVPAPQQLHTLSHDCEVQGDPMTVGNDEYNTALFNVHSHMHNLLDKITPIDKA